MAAATAMAMPDTVLITKMFWAISMDTSPSRSTRMTGQGVLLPPVRPGHLGQLQLPDIPRHGGLGHREARPAQTACQLLLGTHLLIFYDLHNLCQTSLFHSHSLKAARASAVYLSLIFLRSTSKKLTLLICMISVVFSETAMRILSPVRICTVWAPSKLASTSCSPPSRPGGTST